MTHITSMLETHPKDLGGIDRKNWLNASRHALMRTDLYCLPERGHGR